MTYMNPVVEPTPDHRPPGALDEQTVEAIEHALITIRRDQSRRRLQRRAERGALDGAVGPSASSTVVASGASPRPGPLGDPSLRRAAQFRMLDALEAVAGKGARALVKAQPDPAIQRIVAGWSKGALAARAERLGLKPEAQFADIILQYIADHPHAVTESVRTSAAAYERTRSR